MAKVVYETVARFGVLHTFVRPRTCDHASVTLGEKRLRMLLTCISEKHRLPMLSMSSLAGALWISFEATG